ncbi:MAG: ribosome biogenesis GTPase YlqF [Pseudomonadales bacterium]|nr:ribosome biogenesis GTPase YlqF [Pseudomonadales bacterium]
MTIGWYPGHMNKARKDITKAIKSVDAVMEIVDARLPAASANPLLAAIIGSTPCLRVLNKADLADPLITAHWMQYFQQHGIRAVALDKSRTARIRDLGNLCQREFRKPGKHLFRLMIVGIPNVGKSTLLNILLDRKIARVGNEPAVTKASQEYKLSDQVILVDTPGMLWPKIEDQDAAYRLAASGAIKNTAIEFEDIALFSVNFLREHYPALLQARYQLSTLPEHSPDILAAIAHRCGCLRKGGVDYVKVAEILIKDLRAGKIGPVSFEKPLLIQKTTAQVNETQA